MVVVLCSGDIFGLLCMEKRVIGWLFFFWVMGICVRRLYLYVCLLVGFFCDVFCCFFDVFCIFVGLVVGLLEVVF